jgi:hypothetical protein
MFSRALHTRCHFCSVSFNLVDGRSQSRYHQVIEKHVRMAVGFNNVWENKKIQNETFKLEAELIGF